MKTRNVAVYRNCGLTRIAEAKKWGRKGWWFWMADINVDRVETLVDKEYGGKYASNSWFVSMSPCPSDFKNIEHLKSWLQLVELKTRWTPLKMH